MNITMPVVLALIAIAILCALYLHRRKRRQREEALARMLSPNPNLQAFQLAPGVVYAAETAEQACSLANDECFDEYSASDARQLREDELSTVVRLLGEPTEPDATTTLREELEFRRSIGRAGELCGAPIE